MTDNATAMETENERGSVSEMQLLTKSFCYNTHLVWNLMTDQREVVIIMKYTV